MKVGFALRSTVFGPSLISKMIPLIEKSKAESVWFPSVGHAFDALDMCGIALGESRRLRVGTGVIRSYDYEAAKLLARIHTLSEGSGHRFILGIGTGSGTGRPAIEELANLAAKLRGEYRDGQRPPMFFAALKRRMLGEAYRSADGAILNFCPPDYVKKIAPEGGGTKGFTMACYVKLFFAEKDEVAREMLIDEVKMYNAIPQYRAMFREIGCSDSIESLDPRSSQEVPDDLLEISLANPTDAEVSRMLRRFVLAGVDLPIVYPYVAGDDGYKAGVVERLASAVA
jgi:alkanesulfonate monooxygenase SsuD/methylene tetrahydromethanopterin reductase-like flavin-dependent oxidoreductase (luciferase family)